MTAPVIFHNELATFVDDHPPQYFDETDSWGCSGCGWREDTDAMPGTNPYAWHLLNTISRGGIAAERDTSS